MPNTLTLDQFFQRMPKVEIHCHLFGTIRPETLQSLSQHTNNPFSDADIATFYARGEKPVGVLHLFRTMERDIITQPSHLYRLTYEYLEDAHAGGVRYAEFFWNPTRPCDHPAMHYDDAQLHIINAIHDAERDFGIVGRLLPAIDREASPEEADAEPTAEQP